MNFLKFSYLAGKKLACPFLIVLLFSFSPAAYSQSGSRNDTPPLRERLFFGGNVGLQFGTITDIHLSPVVGVWLRPRVAVALGPDYHFFKYQDIKTDVYGGKGYMEFVLIQNINRFIPLGANTGIFLHLEDALLSLESSAWKDPNAYSSDRFFINTILAGPGLSQQIGRRASLNIMFLWVLNDSGYEIFSNPDFRVSFTF
jgi:hypothetical protein